MSSSNIDIEQFEKKDLPNVTKGEKEEIDKPHLEIEYNLQEKEVRDSLKIFQRKNLFMRNFIYSSCCFAIIMVNLWDMIFRNNISAINYAFIGIGLSIIVILWYNQRYYRNKMAKVIGENNDIFTMSIYMDHIYIKETDGGTRLKFNNPSLKVYEQPDKLIVAVSRERIYVIPKRCLKEGQEVTLKEYLKGGLTDRYIITKEQVKK